MDNTILTEDPWVFSISSTEIDSRCYRCLRLLLDYKKSNNRCSGCGLARYCSVECQHGDWTDEGGHRHKYECQVLKLICERGFRPPTHFLLILKILARLQFASSKEENVELSARTTATLTRGRTYQILISHVEEMKKKPSVMEYVPQLHLMLNHYFSRSNQQANSTSTKKKLTCPSIEETLEMLGKIQCNSMSIMDENNPLLECAVGIYLEGSKFDHSCQPNACQIFRGTRLVIKSISPISDLTTVRISYVDRLFPTKIRQRILAETFFFDCSCPRCTAPDQEAEMYAIHCVNPTICCPQEFPSDERADHPCPTCGYHADSNIPSPLTRYEELVEQTYDWINKNQEPNDYSKNKCDDIDPVAGKLWNEMMPFFQMDNPLIAVVTIKLAVHLMHATTDKDNQTRELQVTSLLAQAAEICRKWLPTTDPVLGYLLVSASRINIIASRNRRSREIGTSNPRPVKAIKSPREGNRPKNEVNNKLKWNYEKIERNLVAGQYLSVENDLIQKWLEQGSESLELTFGKDYPLYLEATKMLQFLHSTAA